MGTRGPVPKRSTERRRRNADSTVETIAAPGTPVEQPDADPAWHATATRWYVSLAESGQADNYEPSDWAAAYVTADAMTRLFTGEKFSAMLFASVWSAMGDLLTTEASRRRVRLEIDREPVGTPASVTAIAGYRNRVGG